MLVPVLNGILFMLVPVFYLFMYTFIYFLNFYAHCCKDFFIFYDCFLYVIIVLSLRIFLTSEDVNLLVVLLHYGFELTKKRSKRYPAKTITDADYADDLALLANTPNQAATLLHSLERGIGLHVKAHKTEYMCYNQTGNITTLDGASLRLVDKFTYQGSSVSSTENDIDTRLTKAWTAQFLPGSGCIDTAIWMHYMDAN